MPATTAYCPTPAPSAALIATLRQGDLLDVLNCATTAPTARKYAKRLLNIWYPMTYGVWTEHNG